MSEAENVAEAKKPTAAELTKEIKAYHAELFVDGNEDSVKTQIDDYYNELLVDAEGSESIRTQITKTHTVVAADAAGFQPADISLIHINARSQLLLRN